MKLTGMIANRQSQLQHYGVKKMEGMDPLRIGETIKIKRIQKRITQTNSCQEA